jgi:hypothetical protein
VAPCVCVGVSVSVCVSVCRCVGVDVCVQEAAAAAANQAERKLRAMIKEIKASRKAREAEEGVRQSCQAEALVRLRCWSCLPCHNLYHDPHPLLYLLPHDMCYDVLLRVQDCRTKAEALSGQLAALQSELKSVSEAKALAQSRASLYQVTLPRDGVISLSTAEFRVLMVLRRCVSVYGCVCREQADLTQLREALAQAELRCSSAEDRLRSIEAEKETARRLEEEEALQLAASGGGVATHLPRRHPLTRCHPSHTARGAACGAVADRALRGVHRAGVAGWRESKEFEPLPPISIDDPVCSHATRHAAPQSR